MHFTAFGLKVSHKLKYIKHKKTCKSIKHLRAYHTFYSFMIKSQSQIKIYIKFMTFSYEIPETYETYKTPQGLLCILQL